MSVVCAIHFAYRSLFDLQHMLSCTSVLERLLYLLYHYLLYWLFFHLWLCYYFALSALPLVVLLPPLCIGCSSTCGSATSAHWAFFHLWLCYYLLHCLLFHLWFCYYLSHWVLFHLWFSLAGCSSTCGSATSCCTGLFSTRTLAEGALHLL